MEVAAKYRNNTYVASEDFAGNAVVIGQGVASAVPRARTAQTGIWVTIGAITMCFAALTSALVVRQGAATDWKGFALPHILFASTFFLLLSSGTLEFCRRRFQASLKLDDQAAQDALAAAKKWLLVTLALGLLFVAGQILAVRSLVDQGIFLSTNPSSSFFYVFTVLHGLHVFGGFLGLLYALRRLKTEFTETGIATLAAAATYWHFLTVLWLYLLAVLAVRM